MISAELTDGCGIDFEPSNVHTDKCESIALRAASSAENGVT